MPPAALENPRPGVPFGLAVLAAIILSLMTAPARAATVVALPPAECREVRSALEQFVPIAPGFRQIEIDFPENRENIKGRLCRLVAVGTGVHFESERIRTLVDMQAFLRHALKEIGWRETEQTKHFAGKSTHGRHVFAVSKNNAICVATTQVDMIPGADPPKAAFDNGTVFLGSLRPFERDWWVAVDCFHF